MYNMYSIVSSIEFDKDADYFAIAGVTKKIKVRYEDRYLQFTKYVVPYATNSTESGGY